MLIGPNGAGKSNLVDAIGLLRAAPTDIATPIRESGGVADWIWHGEPIASCARVDVDVANPAGPQPLRYGLEFAAQGAQGKSFQILNERLAEPPPASGDDKPWVCFEADSQHATVYCRETADGGNEPSGIDFAGHESVLALLKNPDLHPEITDVGREFGRMRLYRHLHVGRDAPMRLPQRSDAPNNVLAEDGRNLGLVLNRLSRSLDVKQRLLKALRNLYAKLSDFHVNVNIEYSTVQVFIQEGNVSVPATRLSDGTLHYLCLLAVLCDPTPSPLVCIEEPELGLHPDAVSSLADLLVEASDRTQLVVTTHSDALVSALTGQPHAIVTCERGVSGTELRRLDPKKLASWLEEYRLGDLWRMGELGANP